MIRTNFLDTDLPSEGRKVGTKCQLLGFGIGAVLLTLLTGCVGYVDRPGYARGYAESPVYVESGAAYQDDYVYYPAYQVYYSNNRHQYIYQENRSWVTRATPPRVSAEVLLSSPSVRLDFHDSPAAHHNTVVRQYPKHWTPPSHRNYEDRGEKNRRND